MTPEETRAYHKDYYRNNPDKFRRYRAVAAEKVRNDPSILEKKRIRDRPRYRRYSGLPEPTRARPEKCELCGKACSRMNLDHDHVTGKFRGWLCVGCNTGIGKLGDNVEGLQRAIKYLEVNG